MKRALKKKVKAVLEIQTGDETPVESSNLTECGSVRRKRTQAAMIGLAISMGASSLLVTRQSDQALAAAPVGNQNTASTPSAADNLSANGSQTANSLYSHRASRVSAPETQAIAEPTAAAQVPGLGAKWQVAARSLPTQYPQSGITSQSPAQQNSLSQANASKGDRIANAIAKAQEVKTPQAVVPTPVVGIAKSTVSTPIDTEFKAQQEYAIQNLQKKSDRLRASLTEYRQSANSESLAKLSSEQSISEQNNQELVNPGLANLNTGDVSANQVGNGFAVASSKTYEVQPGDTLAAIASKNGTSVAELIAANNITNPHQLQIRQKLAIPVANQPEVINTPVPVAAATVKAMPVKPMSVQQLNAQPMIVATTASVLPASTNQLEVSPSNSTGMGGDSPVPRVFVEMERRKNANKQARLDPGLQSLQAEIERLRQKYRDQRSGNRANSRNSRPNQVAIPVPTNRSQPVAIPVPVQRRERIASPARTNNNYFNYNAAPVQIPVPRPLAQPNFANEQPVKSEWSRRNAGNITIPVPTAEGSSSFGTMRGAQVSPQMRPRTQLPPLAAVDRYLPQPVEENTPISNGFIWPAKGALTSGYGRRWGRMHRGIDIANSVGTPIYATSAGVVEKAGWNNGGYGYLVDIRHTDGTLSRYAHNSRIMVQKGEQVQQGQQISAMGNTGFSTGPHLHFEIHPAGKGAVNPIAFLPPRV